jgi:hypothetical protein
LGIKIFSLFTVSVLLGRQFFLDTLELYGIRNDKVSGTAKSSAWMLSTETYNNDDIAQ